MLYKFITASDEITFLAPNDKIAYCCTVIIGAGQAGCQNVDTQESLDTMVFFSSDPLPEITETLGMEISLFVRKFEIEVADCFGSFAYCSVNQRKKYDSKLESLKNPEEIEAFKNDHEAQNSTSMNRWVKKAWEYSSRKAVW